MKRQKIEEKEKILFEASLSWSKLVFLDQHKIVEDKIINTTLSDL